MSAIKVGPHRTFDSYGIIGSEIEAYPGNTHLVIRMIDGSVHRIRHTAGYLDGIDVYAVHREITAALDCKTPPGHK